jgi:hypothetical protein
MSKAHGPPGGGGVLYGDHSALRLGAPADLEAALGL